MANVELAENERGLTTLCLSEQLTEVSRNAHEEFLAAQSLRYWKLVVIQIPDTRHILVFSGGPNDHDAPEDSTEPDYALSDAAGLAKQIGEILTLHHEQQTRHASPASSR